MEKKEVDNTDMKSNSQRISYPALPPFQDFTSRDMQWSKIHQPSIVPPSNQFMSHAASTPYATATPFTVTSQPYPSSSASSYASLYAAPSSKKEHKYVQQTME